MNTSVISFELDTTDPTAKLGFEFWIDDVLVSDIDHVTELQQLTYQVNDEEEVKHQLKLVLKNKTWEHTKIDSAGNIISDARLIIKNVKFDEIELGQVFTDLNEYHHQNNDPNGNTVIDKFYNEMGCNGAVILNFSTPIYLWLLESM